MDGTPIDTQAAEPALPVVQRLRQRKVVQWTLAYAAAAWAGLQLLGMVAQSFGWAPSATQIALVGAACGVPLTMVLAWYHGERGQQRVNAVELSILALLLAVAGGLLWSLQQRADGGQEASVEPAGSPVAVPEGIKRIAVLPFANLSAAAENAFFADGLHDELLNALAKVGGLQVISRTSMLTYRDTAKDVRTIGRELQASHVLEGSVRREGDTVRLTLQLIDAGNDNHLWAETYDRRMENSLALQSEVALTVAGTLQATISPEARSNLASATAVDPRAVDLYLRARQISTNAVGVGDAAARKRELLDAAIAIAPDYGAAYAERADQSARRFVPGRDTSVAEIQHARADVATARRLLGDDPAVLLAEAAIAYYMDRDYPRAIAIAERSVQLWPAHADSIRLQAYVYRRVGRIAEATQRLELALALDPFDLSGIITVIDHLYASERNYERAHELLTRAIGHSPPGLETASLIAQRREVEFQLTGDLQARVEVLAALTREPVAAMSSLNLWRTVGVLVSLDRLAEAEATLIAWPNASITIGRRYPKSLYLARLAWARGDRTAAAAHAGQARTALEAELAAGAPPALTLADLAQAQALRGEAAAARELMTRALAAQPDDDVMSTTTLRVIEVEVLARLGETGAAVARIRELLQRSYGFQPAEILHDPILGALVKDEPAYRRLVDELRRQVAARAARWRAQQPATTI